MDSPRVTVLTPVYNGAEYLAECIDSVLAQDYPHWEYYIVNNRSTDDTLRIAERYAAKDPRIRVHTNEKFVSMPENHNNAFRLVPLDSPYCKVVCADDWIEPQCLGKMVRFALAHPSVGIVVCYQQSGNQVRWRVLPPSVEVLPGRDACRKALLEDAWILGAPTASLYRSDLLRLKKPFFPNNKPHADTSACFEVLDRCDLGFVTEILAVERLHEEQITSGIEPYGAGGLAFIEVLLEYGPRYLTEAEFAARKAGAIETYYRDLGGALLKLKPRKFWDFQKTRLKELGMELEWPRVAKAAMAEAVAEAKNPRAAARKVMAVMRSRRTRG